MKGASDHALLHLHDMRHAVRRINRAAARVHDLHGGAAVCRLRRPTVDNAGDAEAGSLDHDPGERSESARRRDVAKVRHRTKGSTGPDGGGKRPVGLHPVA